MVRRQLSSERAACKAGPWLTWGNLTGNPFPTRKPKFSEMTGKTKLCAQTRCLCLWWAPALLLEPGTFHTRQREPTWHTSRETGGPESLESPAQKPHTRHFFNKPSFRWLNVFISLKLSRRDAFKCYSTVKIKGAHQFTPSASTQAKRYSLTRSISCRHPATHCTYWELCAGRSTAFKTGKHFKSQGHADTKFWSGFY